MKIGNIHIKFFDSLGLAIFKDVYTKPYNQFLSHTWNFVFIIVRIQITWLSDEAYKEGKELREKCKNEN